LLTSIGASVTLLFWKAGINFPKDPDEFRQRTVDTFQTAIHDMDLLEHIRAFHSESPLLFAVCDA